MAADQWEADLIQEIKKITSALDCKSKGLPSPGSYKGWSIYKVPKRLRKLNEEAYTPKLVSIGPLHHGQPHLNSMERYKVEYCKNFLKITHVKSKEVIKLAIECEAEVRSQYQDTVKFSREKIVKMIVLDGLFIIMLFLKEAFPTKFDSNDKIFNQWTLKELLHDMMLLENQLPSFVLENLLNMVPRELLRNNTFSDLTRHYFRYVRKAGRVAIDKRRHLVEYLQTFHLMSDGEADKLSSAHRSALPSREKDSGAIDEPRREHKSSIPNREADSGAIDEQRRRVVEDSQTLKNSQRKKIENTRSATELYAAGIQFVKSEDPCILNIEFTEGRLTIPHLKVNQWTETLFRNLIAFEQCDHQRESISSYIIFLDYLINTPMDVDLLEKHEIIENSLGDSERVSDLFNNLFKETLTEYGIFYYTDICRKLNAYNKDYRHQWRAARYRWNVILKRDYFSNPWSVISVIAATILLILTVVQTVCSIMSL